MHLYLEDLLKHCLIYSVFLNRELLFEDGKPKKLGQVIMMPKFARTLEKIRNDPESFYTGRSEEHTSELQSRQYLVCRLLLEKKK